MRENYKTWKSKLIKKCIKCFRLFLVDLILLVQQQQLQTMNYDFSANLLKHSKIKLNRLVLFLRLCSILCNQCNGCVRICSFIFACSQFAECTRWVRHSVQSRDRRIWNGVNESSPTLKYTSSIYGQMFLRMRPIIIMCKLSFYI